LKRFFILVLLCLFLGIGNSIAANDTTNTPMRIDTFGSDVVISTGRSWIENIVITAYTSAKTVTFIDDDGGVVLVIECPAGYTVTWPNDGTGPKEFTNGINFDDSASGLAASDFIFIWKSKTGNK